LGVLIANGLDEDSEDRSVQPVYVTNDRKGYWNKLNSAMDHIWDGFYTGQKHKSMFPTLIETGHDYTVEYTGTPFLNMEYMLRAETGKVNLRILYWNAGSYEVYVRGKLVRANFFDKNIGTQAKLKGTKGCGENRFVGGVDNYLEFVLTAGCRVEVKPVDSFPANVRMDWSMDEFYAQGGHTTFADRVAGTMGVHSSQVKVVNVYKGSVVVDFVVDIPEEP